MRILAKCQALVVGLMVFVVASATQSAGAAPTPGESIYRDGVLPSGAPLRGARDGIAIESKSAACAQCHRRSGLGGYEGTITVPPILGRYLFRDRQTNLQDLSLPHISGFLPNSEAYTEATLAEALRTGHAPGGRTLSALMPRYDLDPHSMRLLVNYLHGLGNDAVSGVSATQLDFATIVTPDSDPAVADAMLSVLKAFFAVQNRILNGEVPAQNSNHEISYRVERRWQLHVWRLEGAASTWRRQLELHATTTPVFAIIAGIGAATWQPIHDFCEQNSVPCLLPNVDLPVVSAQDSYSVYWSRGVLLEADLIARALRDDLHFDKPGGRVVQIFRAEDIGAAAAAALRAQLSDGARILDRVLSADGVSASRVFADLRAGDRVVVWLRNADLAILPHARPVGIYVSGLMAGLERATPPDDWRQRMHLTYPFDLPDLRRARMNFPLGWMRVQQVPVLDERVQTDTYIACQVVAEALGTMLDAYVPDFLIERIESMVSTRLNSGYYPRLGLAPGQRFVSKGGYLVHFAGPTGRQLVAESDWITP